jgi:hypothetical protein
MTDVAGAAVLALPVIILPIFVGVIMRMWLKTKVESSIAVGLAAVALHVSLLAVLAVLLRRSDLAGAEAGDGVQGLSGLFLFGMLGTPIAVAVALRIRTVVARNAGKVDA